MTTIGLASYHDCGFLNGYELQLAGTTPQTLVSPAERGFTAIFQLTNPDIRMADGPLIPKEEFGVKGERVIDAHTLALHEVITFQNFGLQPIKFPVSLTFQSTFEDVYAVRELPPEPFDTRRPPSWNNGILSSVYEGKDGIYWILSVHLSPQGDETGGTTVQFYLSWSRGSSARSWPRLSWPKHRRHMGCGPTYTARRTSRTSTTSCHVPGHSGPANTRRSAPIAPC